MQVIITVMSKAKKMGSSYENDPVSLKRAMVAGEGFEPSTFGLCVPLQLSLPGESSLWSGLSLHPRTGLAAVRMPAIKSLHLLSEPMTLEAWLGVTSLPASPNLTGDRTEVSLCTAHCRRDCPL